MSIASVARHATSSLTRSPTELESIQFEAIHALANMNSNTNNFSPVSLLGADEASPSNFSNNAAIRHFSPPAFLQATHLPTPPYSIPSVLSSAEEQPLDSPCFATSANQSGLYAAHAKYGPVADLLTTRAASLAHKHGLSPPWSNASAASSQTSFASFPQALSPAYGTDEWDDTVPAVAQLLCSGLKEYLKPVVGQRLVEQRLPQQSEHGQVGLVKAGEKRSCRHFDTEASTFTVTSAGPGLGLESLKRPRKW